MKSLILENKLIFYISFVKRKNKKILYLCKYHAEHKGIEKRHRIRYAFRFYRLVIRTLHSTQYMIKLIMIKSISLISLEGFIIIMILELHLYTHFKKTI